MDRLNISLDTLREDRFTALTRRGSLKEVLSGLEAAEAAGFSRLKLNTVLIGGFNEDEIANLAALTLERPWSVRFIELMPMGVCAAFPESWLCAGGGGAGDPAGAGERGPGRRGRVLPVARRQRHRGAHPPAEPQILRPVQPPAGHGGTGASNPAIHTAEELPIRGLRGGALERALREAVARKPAGHCLETLRRSAAARDMNEIGG